MRRIVIAVMGTLSTLVMLFAFDASHRTGGGVTTALGADGGGAGTGSGGGAGSAATGATDDTGTLGSGDAGTVAGTQPSSGEGTDDGSTPPATTAAAAPTSAAAGAKKTSTGAKSYTGTVVMTQWGPVQVRIAVKGGKIIDTKAVVYPNSNGHDIAINGWALPMIRQAVLQAQSANFDNFSGATVTTDGYKQSLQSALDQARI